jgi:hypothetical protein
MVHESMVIKASHLTLHRYFLNASKNHSLFLRQLQTGKQDHPETRIYLELWYACLFVVVEGWRKEAIRDNAVTAFLRDKKNLALLKGCRNVVFHYERAYTDARLEKLFADEDFVEWVNGLYAAISDFFLRE